MILSKAINVCFIFQHPQPKSQLDQLTLKKNQDSKFSVFIENLV